MNTEILVNNVITINGPCEPLDKIREELTIDNPKYANTIKYSKWKGTKVPPRLRIVTAVRMAGVITCRGVTLTD